jgi:hypothetical protein
VPPSLRERARVKAFPRASPCSRTVAYAQAFPYDDVRRNLIVSYSWKEWIDGNQDPG